MKRKFKLIITIASISLCLGLLVFGVLSATSVSLSISSSISYVAEGISFKLYGTSRLASIKPTSSAVSVISDENLIADVNVTSAPNQTTSLPSQNCTYEQPWVVYSFTVKNTGSNVISVITVEAKTDDSNILVSMDSSHITANIGLNEEISFRVFFNINDKNQSISNVATQTKISLYKEGEEPVLTTLAHIAPASLKGYNVSTSGDTTTWKSGDKIFEVTISTNGSVVTENNVFTNGSKITTFTTTYDTSTVQTLSASVFENEYVVAERTLKSMSITGGDKTSIIFPNWLNLIDIGDVIARNFDSVIINVVLPDTLKTIAGRAFDECTKLISINIPDGVTSIGTGAFTLCSSLASDTSTITIPESVLTIGAVAFDGCNKIKTVIINSGAISSSLVDHFASGKLAWPATTIKIKTGLTVGSYVIDNYPNVSTEVIDGVNYTVYRK